jgi:N-acetylneuraminic acid mutarotase
MKYWQSALLIVTGTLLAFFHSEAPAQSFYRTLTFAERVAYQRAIEDIYWRHRIWPKENPAPKPSFDAVMSQAQLEKKVEDYLDKSQALEDYWRKQIAPEQLQAEMDRMARNTKQPEVLRELFEALGNDPFAIAECLARSVLSERLLANFGHNKEPSDSALPRAEKQLPKLVTPASANYTLPAIPNGCVDNTWTATSTINAPTGRIGAPAVWTGSEMIVWGGVDQSLVGLDTGGIYNPSTDSWTPTSMVNVPTGRFDHTAAWTGTEMIVWGGNHMIEIGMNTGGRYNPSTDSWTPTSTNNAPTARYYHSAVWTGSEMIIWGGALGFPPFFANTGGRYNPSMDSWTATSTTNAPDGRNVHTAVWTGGEMIVWGGVNSGVYLNTGGKYNPGTNSWTGTSTTNAPSGRSDDTAVWTGSEMIVWGGNDGSPIYLNTGGVYGPGTDSWTGTSTTDAPSLRAGHTAVWTGSEMIIWGGADLHNIFNTGGRYNPSADRWTATSTTNAPDARASHTAVWSGSEMIVWGGGARSGYLNTGGRYCAQPSATPTPTSTPRFQPTPRSRPTPPPRP